MDTVYYFPIDGAGNETGEAIPVSLKADGSVDLSHLPSDMVRTYEVMGIPDEMHLGRLYPRNGEAFLQALLRMTNGYVRFRSSSGQATKNPFAV